MSFLDFDDNDRASNPFLLSSSSSLLADDAITATSRDARDAADEETLLKEFKQNPKAALALAESYAHALKAPRQPMTEITPIPGFVLQTQTTKESNKVPMIKDAQQTTVVFPKDTAVFINICHSDQMPKPPPASEAEIRKAVNAEEGATYQVPFQLSPPREYHDSVSRRYLVLDACIHTEPFKRTEKDFDYKLYIMELAMEWVEEKCRIELSREFQLPDIKSKDELKKRPVILPKPPAIQEMGDWNPGNTTGTTRAAITAVTTTTVAKTKSKDNNPTFVPLAGKDDIPLKSRLLPCPNGTKGIIVEIDLPNHKSMDGVTLDVVLPDRLVIHSKSQGLDIDQGKEYHVEVDLPNEPVDLDAVRAEFNKASKTLRVYTIKKARK
ncbi:MAG: pre-RNA processing PIH1/Nop17-domain-containing protein [Benniella sp.]|nr:MAG: pre-RNA processing PIH1/Nop17-domain-containing protein [Benniella sp.]